MFTASFLEFLHRAPPADRILLRTMEAEFALEAMARMKVLNGQCAEDDLQPLYHRSTGRLRSCWLRTARARSTKMGMGKSLVCPDVRQFRTLFKAFAGKVSHVRLPSGCFYAGSSVLACTQIPQELYIDELNQFTCEYDLAAERRWQAGFMSLRRHGIPRALVKHILYTAETVDDSELLRERICAHYPERVYDTPEWDVYDWSANDFGPYARSDVDIFVTAKSQTEADSKVARVYDNICQLEGRQCTALRTPNSVTIVRDWPERHVQIIVLYMRSVAEHLLFADLDCTCLAFQNGQVLASSRGMRALRSGKNVVPDSMLLNRKDTPERIGSYKKRGFDVYSISDARVDMNTMQQLYARIGASYCAAGTKFFSMSEHLSDNGTGRANVQLAVEWLSRANTSYRSWNLPRMPGITSEIVQRFFLRVEQMARENGEPLITALLGEGQPLPPAQLKLHKSQRELWSSWGLLPKA